MTKRANRVLASSFGVWALPIASFLRLCCLSGMLLAAHGAVAQDSMVPTVIADLETGEVLHAESATRPWHPASTTKLMTAYTALRAVRDGTLKMETPLAVSRLASAQRPSKIGVKPGQEITLENALMLLMVKSANDLAVVIAEGVAGSVPAFADMMNRDAKRIGMRESHFVNPHGWEDGRQYSSARDMAMLARALLLEFPDYAEYWSIGAVRLGSRTFANTNGLMGRYSGAIGMKTGFICASGFNLVAAARRDGRTLIAVVFGAATGADRTLKAAQLLDQGFGVGGGFFGRSGQGRSLAQLTSSLETQAPNRRADICRRGAPPASETDDTGGAIAYGDPTGDNPSRMMFSGRGHSEAAAVGMRVGNAIQLGPRARFEPVIAYLGRKPGSTEVARGPGARNPAATTTAAAFASQPNARASGAPLALPGGITNPGRIGTQPPAARRPAAAASLQGRPQAVRPAIDPQPRAAANPKAQPPKAKLPPKADAKAKAKQAATSNKAQPKVPPKVQPKRNPGRTS
jgi:D-alanyl-D-alanine carboxypeptidase